MSNILLVEDDKSTVALLKQYIFECDSTCNVIVSTQAAEALQYAKNQKVDLFVLDIQLTDYKGTSLAKQLRSIPEYKYTPIVFATALAGEEIMAYRETQCYSFLIKPFSKAEFKKTFYDALGMSKQIHSVPKTIRIEQKQFVFEYEIINIVYIESFGKRVVIHTRRTATTLHEDTISGYSLLRLLELAPDSGIIQCHKSFLTNRSYIQKIDKQERVLYLKNCAAKIPIGDKYQHLLWGQVKS